jgi:hypothetical protein
MGNKRKGKIIALFFISIFIILPLYLCINELSFREINYCDKSLDVGRLKNENFTVVVVTLGNEFFNFSEDNYPHNIYLSAGINIYLNSKIPIEIESLYFILKDLKGNEIKYKTITLSEELVDLKFFKNIQELLKYKSPFNSRSSIDFFYDPEISSNEKLVIEYSMKLKYNNKIYQYKNVKVMTKCKDRLRINFF